jgi:hypothetical protein
MQDGAVTSVAFTGPLASQLDERQYEAGFGPVHGRRPLRPDDPDTRHRAQRPYTDFGRLVLATASPTPCPSDCPSNVAPSAR